MSERDVYIGVASNIDRARHVEAGLRALRARFGPLSRSAIYESAACEGGGPPYWNLAVGLESDLDWAALRSALKTIEQDCGRQRGGAPDTPVTLDLDLLIVHGRAGEPDEYELPWPELLQLAHVVVPLAELVPDWRHPEAERTLAGIAAACDAPAGGLRVVAPRPAADAPSTALSYERLSH